MGFAVMTGKKNASFIGAVAVLLSSALVAAATARPQTTTLADRYRSGRLLLRLDEDWTSNLPPELFFESRGDIAVAPDGSVFVSNTTRHTIFKFDAAGRFVKSFGGPGQGPGDLTYPGRLSILDGTFLVVGEYATNQRISLFDLDGKFLKIVGTGRFTSQATALRDGKIAYVAMKGAMSAEEMISIGEVFILDLASGRQRSVVRHEIRNPIKRIPAGGIVMASAGAVILAPTRSGGLVVGTTRGPGLELFAADGTRLRALDTGWEAIPVTSAYRKRHKELLARQAEAEGHGPPTGEPPLPEFLEVLQDVWTDSEGNILVCRKTACLENCPLAVRAYSPEGELLCDFEIDPGPFVLSADWRFKRLALTGSCAYGLLELRDDPDGFLYLIRTVFGAQ